MAIRIVLAWQIDVSGTTYGPTKGSAALAAVPLYFDYTTDPVLGQLFGLTVYTDTISTSGNVITRTLALNINSSGAPTAPPPFPCHPLTATPPTLPYPFIKPTPLEGSFFVTNGSVTVDTAQFQGATIPTNGLIQFLAQQGNFYGVSAVGPTSLTLSSPYTGVTGFSGAFQNVLAPATILAVYSSSALDTASIATEPAIPAGSGAQTVSITYFDSLGAGPFTITVPLTGQRPAAVTLAGGSIDIAEVTGFSTLTLGGFDNNVGQITLVELSEPLPAIHPTASPWDFYNALTDTAQLLIARSLVYMPPSYTALVTQSGSAPQLEGDFTVRTGSTHVPTTVDQTGTLSPGDDIIFFAEQSVEMEQPVDRKQLPVDHRQLPVNIVYGILSVNPKHITLVRPYTGIDAQNGVLTGATKFPAPVAALPDEVTRTSALLGQFVDLETVGPPNFPPLDPHTVPVPTVLSGLFTRTLQLALTVPVTPLPVTFV